MQNCILETHRLLNTKKLQCSYLPRTPPKSALSQISLTQHARLVYALSKHHDPRVSDINVPTTTSRGRLIANATTPPLWQDSWIKYIPLIGKTLLSSMNAGRYVTTLE